MLLLRLAGSCMGGSRKFNDDDRTQPDFAFNVFIHCPCRTCTLHLNHRQLIGSPFFYSFLNNAPSLYAKAKTTSNHQEMGHMQRNEAYIEITHKYQERARVYVYVASRRRNNLKLRQMNRTKPSKDHLHARTMERKVQRRRLPVLRARPFVFCACVQA